MVLLTEGESAGSARQPLPSSAILTLSHHMSLLDGVRAAGGGLPSWIREALGSLAVSGSRTGGCACRNAQLDPVSVPIRSPNWALPPEKRWAPRIQLGKRADKVACGELRLPYRTGGRRSPETAGTPRGASGYGFQLEPGRRAARLRQPPVRGSARTVKQPNRKPGRRGRRRRRIQLGKRTNQIACGKAWLGEVSDGTAASPVSDAASHHRERGASWGDEDDAERKLQLSHSQQYYSL